MTIIVLHIKPFKLYQSLLVYQPMHNWIFLEIILKFTLKLT